LDPQLAVHLQNDIVYAKTKRDDLRSKLETWRSSNKEFFDNLTPEELDLESQFRFGMYDRFTRFVLEDEALVSKFERIYDLPVTGSADQMMRNWRLPKIAHLADDIRYTLINSGKRVGTRILEEASSLGFFSYNREDLEYVKITIKDSILQWIKEHTAELDAMPLVERQKFIATILPGEKIRAEDIGDRPDLLEILRKRFLPHIQTPISSFDDFKTLYDNYRPQPPPVKKQLPLYKRDPISLFIEIDSRIREKNKK
jgi:hypothetical protein